MEHIAYFLTRDGKITTERLAYKGKTEDLLDTAAYRIAAIGGRGHLVKVEVYTANFRPAMDVSSPILSHASPYRIGLVYSWVPGKLTDIALAIEKAGGSVDTPLPLIEGDLDLEEIEADELDDLYSTILRSTCEAHRAACDAYAAAKAPFAERAHKLADKARCHVVVRGSRGDIHVLAAPTA